MANNNFKPFAAAGGANVMTQADYEALAALLTGFQSGTAKSDQLNKVWRQSSIMSAVLAQFIVDLTGQDAIDDGTTATLLANLKTAVQAQSAAVVGQARNVAMSVTAASANATLTADEIVVGTALGGQKYVLGAFSKTINLATTGAGGMDTGSAPLSGYVALYAIYNPSTGASALLATNATASIAPNIYGGGNAPAGYTASALLTVVPTTAGGLFVPLNVLDRTIRTGVRATANISTQTSSPISISLSAIVPLNARKTSLVVNCAGSTAGSVFCNIYETINGVGQHQLASNPNTGLTETLENVCMPSPQTVWYTAGAGGTMTLSITSSGYEL
ncbi:hypothetical protein KTE52_27265 [Burkholderia multivorans]|uniref:Phage tail protein n=1 Tax=Burkholderia multivorans TaxID=87883 RepID=A0AAP2HP34_9BURK|nr:hypothetical protein [Burkholderia multivorans]MBU9360039.1 hypothetical protein [Burkholderia multivorans]